MLGRVAGAEPSAVRDSRRAAAVSAVQVAGGTRIPDSAIPILQSAHNNPKSPAAGLEARPTA
jgi:hypothetical protein